MIESINSHIIANEIRLISDDRSDIFIISETADYAKTIRRIFTKKKSNVIIAHEKQNVIGALIELRKDGYNRIYGCLNDNIDTSKYSDLLPRILFAANWSNQAAKQELGLTSLGNQPSNGDRFTTSSTVVPPQSEISTSAPVEDGVSNNTTQSPEDVISALKEALQMGHSEEAIKLAKLGADLFPDNPHLIRMVKVLAPPVIRISQKSYAPLLTTSHEWLRENAQKYKGKWVAVYEGRLLGDALSIRDLLAQIGPNIDRDNTLITKVL